MKTALAILVTTCTLLWPSTTHAQRVVSTCFSPGGRCVTHIVAAINKAKKTIHVQSYSFTSSTIAKALVKAKERKVEVVVLIDKGSVTGRASVVKELKAGGVTVMSDGKHAIAHNKVMVIDGTLTITGSYNFSNAAEKQNAENLLVISGPKLAEQYEKNWAEHKAHAEVIP